MKREYGQTILIGVLCFLIAASICVQYRSAHKYNTDGDVAVQSMEENKLRDKVLKEEENYNKLYVQAQILQAQFETLRKNSATISEEAKNLEEQLSELNRLLGYTDITGKGLIITLKDADADSDSNVSTTESVIHDFDLIEVVNELFNAGAEAVSINGQRIISTTAITCNGNVVRINNKKITVPFVIKAIGEPNGLYDTMTRPGAYLKWMENDNIKIKIDKEDELVVPKYSGARKYEFLQNVE